MQFGRKCVKTLDVSLTTNKPIVRGMNAQDYYAIPVIPTANYFWS